jgi:hypothetical protein
LIFLEILGHLDSKTPANAPLLGKNKKFKKNENNRNWKKKLSRNGKDKGAK